MQVLAGSHDVQKKSVALQFSGTGKRAVKVGYVLERPIWKTTYRLVLEPNGKLFMQGWAIVENTSDDDWNNVRMVLVSGKPISFRMDLYEPLYIPRPLVEPELFASLRPPVYGGSFGNEPTKLRLKLQQALQNSNRRWTFFGQSSGAAIGGEKVAGFAGVAHSGGRPGPGSSGHKARPVVDDIKPPRLPAYTQPLQEMGAIVTRTQNREDIEQKLAFDEMMKRKAAQQEAGEIAVAGVFIAGLNFKEGIQSIASSQDIGDYFQYLIDQKISLPRQKSAMLPIVNQTIEGSKVSIFNEAVHAKFPLLGIRLKNTSGKPLTQGPITVYEDGSYAGDTRTLDLQPNEERLLSYAIDQGTEVKTTLKTNPAPDMTFNIGGNNLTAAYTMRQTKTYTVKNRTTHDRTIIIEHPIRNDWKLVDPKKPSDRSRDVYRFQIDVKAGETGKQDVVEEQSRTDPMGMISRGKDVPPYYAIADGIEIKPEVKSATGPKLLATTITKGVLEATYKEWESKTYLIQNQSDRDHAITVDHVIRKDWKRLGPDGTTQKGPDVFTFKIEVKSKKTGHQEVVEEHVFKDDSMVVARVHPSLLTKFIAHEAPSTKVKDALQQVLDKQGKLKTAGLELAEAKSALEILAADQARVRENLKIIPQTSEHYKDFLKKFVAQEAQIEDGRLGRIRTQAATLTADE